MKYCTNCGNELFDEAVICPKCGYPTAEFYLQLKSNNIKPNTSYFVVKIFMIIATVINGLYILPLAWCIPMTVNFCKKYDKGIPISTGFKVCTLLFVNFVSGILLLCASPDKN